MGQFVEARRREKTASWDPSGAVNLHLSLPHSSRLFRFLSVFASAAGNEITREDLFSVGTRLCHLILPSSFRTYLDLYLFSCSCPMCSRCVLSRASDAWIIRHDDLQFLNNCGQSYCLCVYFRRGNVLICWTSLEAIVITATGTTSLVGSFLTSAVCSTVL